MSATEAGVSAFDIDRELCAGHGRCYTLAPDSFTFDEMGYGVPTGRPEVNRTDEELHGVVAGCPEEAVRLVPAEHGNRSDEGGVR